MAVRNFKAPNGVKGFIQEEGIFNPRWGIYKNKFFGDEKIGSVEPKEDELRIFLEKTFGRPVKIWGKFLQSMFSSGVFL